MNLFTISKQHIFLFCLMILSASFFWTPSLLAAPTPEDLSVQLDRLEKKVDQTQLDLKDALDNQRKILEKLDQVKVWVRRS